MYCAGLQVQYDKCIVLGCRCDMTNVLCWVAGTGLQVRYDKCIVLGCRCDMSHCNAVICKAAISLSGSKDKKNQQQQKENTSSIIVQWI